LFGIELVLPLVLGNPYLPSTAGQAVIQVGSATHTLAPWTGFTLFAGYTALAVAAAAVALKRRDA
jgi:ABC-2 type transport system permease protein